MNVTVAYGDALQLETPLLALTTWEDEPLPAQVAALVEDGDWNGKFKQLLLLYPRGGLPARRVLLVGLGKRGAITANRLRDGSLSAASRE